MKKFLLSNDDSVDAKGLATLVAVLKSKGDVTVIAPHEEQSGMSSAITKDRPVRLRKIDTDVYSLSGTPVDCVKFAVYHLASNLPDLVVSGINHGANLGQDTIYSGTVGAAVEGALQGIPALAISLCGVPPYRFDTAEAVMHKIMDVYAPHIQRGKILNINIPNVDLSQINGYRFATLGVRSYDKDFHRANNPRNIPYYWMGWASGSLEDGDAGSDCSLVASGYVSLSVLKPTMYDAEESANLQQKTLG